MTALLGIIGGMGTPAGLKIAEHLVNEASAAGAQKDEDFPPFILASIPTHCLDAHGIADGKNTDLLFSLAYHAKRLGDAGCTHLIIGCNSAHVLLPDLKAHFPGTIIDIVSAACSEAVGAGGPVGVLCSRTSRDSGLFKKPIEEHGAEVLCLDSDGEGVLDWLIAEGISGRRSAAAIEGLWSLIDYFEQRGAHSVILGCTELPIFTIEDPHTARIIDPGLIGVRRFIEAWKTISS